jgi:hypothetical protein
MRAPDISFNTRETLDCDTPAILATSVIVGRPASPCFSEALFRPFPLAIVCLASIPVSAAMQNYFCALANKISA